MTPVKGQGEETFPELFTALRGDRKFSGVRGLYWKDAFGLHVRNATRPLRSPNDFSPCLITSCKRCKSGKPRWESIQELTTRVIEGR
jgi:hypothetical protein